jgi:hypothetical protein
MMFDAEMVSIYMMLDLISRVLGGECSIVTIKYSVPYKIAILVG